MIQNISVVNRLGQTFNFNENYKLVNGLDLSGLGAKVNRIQTSSGGSRYLNTILEEREFDMELQIRKFDSDESTVDQLKAHLYNIFTPELSPLRFDFETSDGTKYYLTAYSLNAPVMSPIKNSNNNSAFQKVLLQFVCTDPYIYQNLESRFDLANFDGGLEFDWEIPEDGDVFEERIDSFEGTIDFPGTGVDGMSIRFIASGNVSTPSVTNAITFERLIYRGDLINGDELIINTYRGSRSATLIRDGIRTNVFHLLQIPESTFLELRPGSNSFVYDATAGVSALEIVIEYRIRRVGL